MSEKRVSKRHGRLENFLQKHLPQEYGRVSWYEPCVVVTGNGKPVFSFVVVTDEHLYVIGNPPRQIQTTVHLAGVTNVDIVNDFPEFLSGVDRETAQHIRISYRSGPHVSIGETGRASSLSSRAYSTNSQARSVSVLSEVASTCSAPAGIDSTPNGIGLLGRRRKLRKLLLTLPLKIRDKFQTISGQSSPSTTTPPGEDGASQQSHDSGIGSDASNGDDVSDGNSYPEFLFRSPSPSPWQPSEQKREFNFNLTVPAPSSPGYQTPSPSGSESFTLTPVYPRSPILGEPDTPTSVISNEDVLAGLLQLPISTLQVHVQSGARSATALGNYDDHKPKTRLPRSGTALDENEGFSDFSAAKNALAEPQAKKDSELHVYVLSPECPLFKSVIYSWNGLLVRSTTQMHTLEIPENKRGQKERYEQMLEEMHRHLVGSHDSDIARTRIQLENIAREIRASNVAKRIFWKNLALFPTLVGKLRYLLGAPENGHEKQTIGLTMDKLKLCSVILGIINTFLEGGEATSSRSAHLTNKNARITRELLLGLVAVPWMPLAYRDVILDVVTSHRRLSCPDWELFQEAPLIRSVLELTHHSISALYNIMQLAFQGREMTTKQQTFGMPWIIKVITEVKQWELYVARLMSHILSVSTPTGPSFLSPLESVQLHQKLYVVYLMVNNSPLCDIHFRLNYAEDVRYFVLRKVMGQKIPHDYPIRPSLLLLVDNVRKHVLWKQPIATNNSTIRVTT